MIRVSNLRLPLDYDDEYLKSTVSKELRISPDAVIKIELYRRSIDARKKNDVHFTATIDVEVNSNENRLVSKSKSKNVSIAKPYEYSIPKHKKLNKRPLIVGFGPAGMFAGLILSHAGEKPLIIERGADCDSRVQDIESFIKTGKLNTESNIQFGEGGAGTFSDGKLTTGTKDFRVRKVFLEFKNHGAPDEIMYNAKPHIGTDKLREVVKNIRNDIINHGGEVLFNTKLCDLKIKDGQICAAEIERFGRKELIEAENVILSIGHSSRDTMKMLLDRSVFLEQKPFSVGVRIEHLREKIDRSQFGPFAGDKRLGAAPYKLNVRAKNGRGVYTFCMCPGGEVVPASSEEKMVCTNGMSEFARDKTNSNSALLVGVSPEDYGDSSPISGIEFQRKIERAAYIAGGGDYAAPVQRVGDFLKGIKSERFGEVLPSYGRNTSFSVLDRLFPEYVTNAMKEAIVQMDSKLRGFAHPDAILTGAEARSSSPVRITRNPETLQSVNVKGLYPCGEGAGYAGGIVSAAVDGIKCAEKVLCE